MDLELFNYSLPQKMIADAPPGRRDGARLLFLDRSTGEEKHLRFRKIVDCFKPGDALVINNTKVLKARLLTRRASGGKVEVFLLEEIKHEGMNCWTVLTHPTRRVKEGESLYLDKETAIQIVKKMPDGQSLVRLGGKTQAERLIAKYGHVPLPIYIHRPDRENDEERYQTVYAQPSKAKSVAAPTAGLHFTRNILESIKSNGVQIVPITLHVGYGTFKMVKTPNIEDHTVDPEYAEISKSAAHTLNKVRQNGGKIFAVGTTSVRTLESAPIINGEIQPYEGKVDLYIKPGFKFRVVDHLITNFHLPKSSLIILVSAFAGRTRILHAYKTAIENNYRFYSYGDCMIIM